MITEACVTLAFACHPEAAAEGSGEVASSRLPEWGHTSCEPEDPHPGFFTCEFRMTYSAHLDQIRNRKP